jgi:hypothetical protein
LRTEVVYAATSAVAYEAEWRLEGERLRYTLSSGGGGVSMWVLLDYVSAPKVLSGGDPAALYGVVTVEGVLAAYQELGSSFGDGVPFGQGRAPHADPAPLWHAAGHDLVLAYAEHLQPIEEAFLSVAGENEDVDGDVDGQRRSMRADNTDHLLGTGRHDPHNRTGVMSPRERNRRQRVALQQEFQAIIADDRSPPGHALRTGVQRLRSSFVEGCEGTDDGSPPSLELQRTQSRWVERVTSFISALARVLNMDLQLDARGGPTGTEAAATGERGQQPEPERSAEPPLAPLWALERMVSVLVFGSLRAQCLQLDAAAARERAAAWATLSHAARQLSPAMLGIPEPLAAAVAAALEAEAVTAFPESTAAMSAFLSTDAKACALVSPAELDEALLRAVRCVYTEAGGLLAAGGEVSEVSTEMFFPVLVHVLVNAECSGLHRRLCFMQRFQTSETDEASYYWAAVEAAVAWVEAQAETPPAFEVDIVWI